MILKNHIILNYVKYIVMMLSVFLFIIWISQVIRFLDFGQSVAVQLIEIIKITLFLLPNAVNTIFPIIIFISSCLYNKHINSTNEITIISLYLSSKKMISLFAIIYISVLAFYIYNSEVISVSAYNDFKNKEIEFRNNFKITDSKNTRISIPNKINLFYEKSSNQDEVLNAITFIIEENIIIKSKTVNINKTKERVNFIFNDGQRIAASHNEKSYTNFDKLEYTVIQGKQHQVSYDKDNYNTLELFKSDKKIYNKAGHKKIIDLLFFIIVMLISNKIVFTNSKQTRIIFNYGYNLLIIIITFILISFITKIFSQEIIDVKYFYILSLIILLSSYLALSKKYANI